MNLIAVPFAAEYHTLPSAFGLNFAPSQSCRKMAVVAAMDVVASSVLLLSLAATPSLVPLDDWRAQQGDQVQWALPNFDDSDWPQVKLPESLVAGPDSAGFAWYRRSVKVPTSTPAVALGLGMGLGTAYQVFVDGEVIGTHGRLEPPGEGPGQARSFEIPHSLRESGRVQVALRVWQYQAARRWTTRGSRWLTPPFVVGDLTTVVAKVEHARLEQYLRTVVHLLIGGFLLLIGLFHLLLWRGRPKLAAYGWYGAVIVLQGLGDLAFVRGEPMWPHYTLETSARWEPWLAAASMAASVEFAIAFFGFRRARWRWAYWAVIAVTTLAASRLWQPWADTGQNLLGLATILAVCLVLVRAAVRGDRAARIVAAGLVLAAAGNLINVLSVRGLLPLNWFWSTEGFPVSYGSIGRLFFIGAMALALADRFNHQLNELRRAHDASRRFVPRQFLERLGRREVVDVERGDAAELRMTIMFADVRDFSRSTEGRSAAQTLAWLNAYLGVIEPVIRRHNGFVNQYYGDGIMALFDQAADAIAAAVEMQDALTQAPQLNARIGIGLHTGVVFLGTLGGSERLDTGVVGDAVNTASRIEGQTKAFGTNILMSESTRDAAQSDAEFVAEVNLRGRMASIRLYRPRPSVELTSKSGHLAKGAAGVRSGKETKEFHARD